MDITLPFGITTNTITIIASITVVLVLTAASASLVTRLVRHYLKEVAKTLPASSILINLSRGVIWLTGISIILSNCFGININALVAALGVGGIAVSLGFQDTIANFISGMQMTLMRIIKPGDNIEIEGKMGVVSDMNWRHTTIVNASGQTILIPNSVISTNALTHLPAGNCVAIPITISSSAKNLTHLSQTILTTATNAAEHITPLIDKPILRFVEITPYGFKAKIIITIDSEDLSHIAIVTDQVIRSIAPYTSIEN